MNIPPIRTVHELMKSVRLRFVFFILSVLCPPAFAQPKSAAPPMHLADYDAELRRPDGRVDTGAMVQRLKELNVTTYYWLIAHAATDWDDLKLFLPEAAKAHIEVWAYLVPPSESAPKYSTLYPEPFRLDYQRWAEEIARLSLEHEPCELTFPHYTPSHEGDFVIVSQSAMTSGAQQSLIFLERDDFTGPTAGYHFKQLLVNDSVVWEEDVAGGTNGWREVHVDVSEQARDKSSVKVAFRLFDKKGVSNFGVRWQLKDLRAEGLRLSASLQAPSQWKAEQHGAFEAGFGEALQNKTPRFHIPFIVMTAAQPIEFKLRHGEPASPERVSQWLEMCLEEMRKGKCEGVVTYCLDKSANSPVFPFVQKQFREFTKDR